MTPQVHTTVPAAPVAGLPATAGEPARPTGDLDIEAVQHFKALMAEEGQPVQVARMYADRLYAYERIACAHASAHAGLRRLALALFQSCHRADEQRSALS